MTGTPQPLADPYVRKNIAMLAAISDANGYRVGGTDNLICIALSRRGLLYEQGARVWYLTASGSCALDAWHKENQ